MPRCLQDHPVAVINYRWSPFTTKLEPGSTPLYWPIPLHDVTFAYNWLAENLGASTNYKPASGGDKLIPRPAYVVGSYLGASLAAALAMTECHRPVGENNYHMSVQGLIAYNGIYNWTTFLPDHPLHAKAAKRKRLATSKTNPEDGPPPYEEEGVFTTIKSQIPGLFGDNPENLFDPFASVCLFFHTPNLHVPDDFYTPLTDEDTELPPSLNKLVNILSDNKTQPPLNPEDISEDLHSLIRKVVTRMKLAKPARKSLLKYPPAESDLSLPPTLLLYSVQAPSHMKARKSRKRAKPPDHSKHYLNSFAHQAQDLASLLRIAGGEYELRRGIEKARAFLNTPSVGPEAEEARKFLEEQEINMARLMEDVRAEEVFVREGGQDEGGEVDQPFDGETGELVRKWLHERIEERRRR